MKAEDFDKCKTDNELLDMNISVCYIDGCHEHEYVTIDWKLCLRAIGDKPGIIVFDDTHASGVRSSIKNDVATFRK